MNVECKFYQVYAQVSSDAGCGRRELQPAVKLGTLSLVLFVVGLLAFVFSVVHPLFMYCF